jgi:glucose-6-phosphate isomerase
MTSCGLVPASLMGLDIFGIYKGARSGYEKFNNQVSAEENDTLKLALYLFELEQKGYGEIFSGIYSTALFGFFPLMVQLVHESTGKNGQGQTIYGDYSPESQHHTNQRFFGGKRNVVGLFVSQEKSKDDFEIEVPEELKKIPFKDGTLAGIDGNSARETMKFDMAGVIGNAKNKKIPVVEISVDEINPESVGEYMVFWQYFAMYSAFLRNQNPFDQPEVEDAKVLSFKLRTAR